MSALAAFEQGQANSRDRRISPSKPNLTKDFSPPGCAISACPRQWPMSATPEAAVFKVDLPLSADSSHSVTERGTFDAPPKHSFVPLGVRAVLASSCSEPGNALRVIFKMTARDHQPVH
jgi:hypothetical protein